MKIMPSSRRPDVSTDIPKIHTWVTWDRLGQLGQIGGSNMGCQGTHNFGQFEVWFLYVSLLCVQ